MFDGHVICLFSPNGLFSWPREGERGRERKRNQERGRADRFTPSPLLAPPMSHLILLLTAKSTPLTHSWLVQTTTADCLLLCPTVCLGGISGYVSLHHTVCSPSLTMSHRQHPFLYPIPNESSHGTLFHDGEKEGKSEK